MAKQKQTTKNTETEDKVEENVEDVKKSEWLEKASANQKNKKKSESKESESEGELPAWVKNAGGYENEEVIEENVDTPEVKTEVDQSKEGESKEDMPATTEQAETEKKKGLLDKIMGFFAPAPKKEGVQEEKVPTTLKPPILGIGKEKVSPEEKKRLLEAEKIYQEGLSSVRDLIAPSSMEINFDHIRLEGIYAQTFYVYAYPRFLDANWLSPIINFDVSMDISQFIYPIDSSRIMKILKGKVAQMQSAMRISEEKGNVRDPAIETALQDAEELRTQIQRGQEKFFQFGLYITIYADDLKKLSRVAKQIETLLGGKLILTKKAEFQAEHAFNSTLPLSLDELEVNLNMNTSPLSTTFPFSSSELTSNTGILYGLNRHNDSLIIFDRFTLENANSVVFAKSGAGKSYAVKLEILRTLMFGTDVIIVDPENEYQAICDTVGGSYLKVSLNSDRRINPFDLPAPLKDEEVKPGDLLRSNIIAMHGLLKIMLGGVTPEEEGMLDKALTDVYAIRGITMDLEDPSTFPPPTMEDLYDILNSMEGAKNLATRLAKFTEGTYAGIFNKPTNIDLTAGLVVFNIRDLEDALRPIAMYIILNFIWNRVRSSLKRRMLVIDEAWALMQHDDSARFLYGIVKRARKYYLGVTTITQDVEDFVQNKFGKPIITNSSLQLLLKQAPAALDILQKIFNLTEGEKYMLLNSGIGQGLFFAGTRHVAIQVIASYGEDKLVTTNPEEILRAEAEAEEYLGEEEVPEEEGLAEAGEEEAPAEEVLAEEVPAEEVPDEEVPEKVPEKVPEEEVPAEEVPAEEVTEEEVPEEEVPEEELPEEELPAEEVPTEEVPEEEVPEEEKTAEAGIIPEEFETTEDSESPEEPL